MDRERQRRERSRGPRKRLYIGSSGEGRRKPGTNKADGETLERANERRMV